MIIFVENDSQIQLDFDDSVIVTEQTISGPKKFTDCIIHLASFQEIPTKNNGLWMQGKKKALFILYNFFSVGCKNLTDIEKRGLERIALGANGIEISDFRQTRFLNHYSSLTNEDVKKILFETNDYQGIGNHKLGNTLIIGESPGKNSFGKNTPFVGSGSGRWLNTQLEFADINESELFWINSKNGFGIPADTKQIEKLQPNKIITLGNIANSFAKQFEYVHPVINIPHPAYWLRFKSGQEYPLIDILKNK